MTPKQIINASMNKVPEKVLQNIMKKEEGMNKAFGEVQNNLLQNPPSESNNNHGTYIDIYYLDNALHRAEKNTGLRHYQIITRVYDVDSQNHLIQAPGVVTVLNYKGLDKPCGSTPIRVSVRKNRKGIRVNTKAQDFGSALTSAKRQSLGSVFGINRKPNQSNYSNGYSYGNSFGGSNNYTGKFNNYRNNGNNSYNNYRNNNNNYKYSNNRTNNYQNRTTNYQNNNQTNNSTNFSSAGANNNQVNNNVSNPQVSSTTNQNSTQTSTKKPTQKVNYISRAQYDSLVRGIKKAGKLNNLSPQKVADALKSYANLGTAKIIYLPANLFNEAVAFLNSFIKPKESPTSANSNNGSTSTTGTTKNTGTSKKRSTTKSRKRATSKKPTRSRAKSKTTRKTVKSGSKK